MLSTSAASQDVTTTAPEEKKNRPRGGRGHTRGVVKKSVGPTHAPTHPPPLLGLPFHSGVDDREVRRGHGHRQRDGGGSSAARRRPSPTACPLRGVRAYPALRMTASARAFQRGVAPCPPHARGAWPRPAELALPLGVHDREVRREHGHRQRDEQDAAEHRAARGRARLF